MSRGLWFVAGAGAGVYAMVRGRRAAEALTADGLRDRWNGLALGARLLREEVAQGRADAEVDLRLRLGLTPAGTPELAAPAGAETGAARLPRPAGDAAPERRPPTEAHEEGTT